jgi:hypothetical protein
MKKCPPGVICIENITFVLLLIIMLTLSYLIYTNINKSIKERKKEKENEDEITYNIIQTPNYPYNNFPVKDVLLNPYVAPYKDERYLIPELTRNSIPINISTNIGAVDTNYRQLGILTPLNITSKDNILPIMGRPLFTSRDKWQYYTISNQHNNVKLPISVKGKSALNDYGVDQLYNGDTVYVEGYNEAFKATIYENDTIKYLPYI